MAMLNTIVSVSMEDPVGIGILPSLPLQFPRSTGLPPAATAVGRWTRLEGTAAAGGDQALSNLPTLRLPLARVSREP